MIARATAAKENPKASRRVRGPERIAKTPASNAASKPAAATSGSNGLRGDERGATGTNELAMVEIVNIPAADGVAEPVLQLVFVGSPLVHESATLDENPPIALIGTV